MVLLGDPLQFADDQVDHRFAGASRALGDDHRIDETQDENSGFGEKLGRRALLVEPALREAGDEAPVAFPGYGCGPHCRLVNTLSPATTAVGGGGINR